LSVQLHTLANGFRIVTEHMTGLESASLGIWVSAGGRNERVDQNGIAHFLEHMAFKGTKRRTALQIAEEIEDVGGYINAYTSREVTAYYARCLKADVPLALDVIADILRNPIFDPREIEIERGVILQEIGQSLDTPDDVVFDWLQEAAYPNQPIGRTILGPTERVSNFSRDDLAEFVGQHYGAGQLILSASGAIDHDQIVRMAEGYFGDMPASSLIPATKATFNAGTRNEIKSLEQAHFTFALEGPGYCDDDFYAAHIFSTSFGGGMSSRLFQEVREKRGLCYSIFANIGSYSDTGMLTIYSGTSGEDISDLGDICIDELKRAADDMSEAEVARARAQMKAGMLMGLESPSSRTERMARNVDIWGRVPEIREVIAKIDAVDVAQVRAFGAKLVDQSHAAMALYGPVEKARSLEDLTRRLAA
jgi:predicted Zn-dependent peptidase